MKYVKKFNSIADMTAALANSPISILGMAMNGNTPVVKIKVVEPPSNLVISCSANMVTISATNATTLQYRLSQSASWATYTEPFAITETVTVYAKAKNGGGSITASQECQYVPVIDYTIPFYIEDVSGSENTVQIKKSNGSAPTITIEKSTDGTTWKTMGTTSTTAITATIPANGKLYLRCSATKWATNNSYYNYFNLASGNFNVGGNINSLLYGSSFNGQTEFPSGVGTYTFDYLFMSNTRIISAQQLLLPATTLAQYCYQNMFRGCSALTTAPALPATTLAYYCYSSMFYNCTSLTKAPALPATTLAYYCYSSMFYNCTSLTTAPELPATTLVDYCYSTMFAGCTSLTSAPALPATTLVNGCYGAMFQNCTSLTSAPALLATTLGTNCYAGMFYNCTNLNYIKCLATDISASGCTSNWVSGVASTGTFVKNPSMSSWTTGNNGIPSGWTVKNPSGIELSQDLNVATIEVTELDTGTGYYTINGGEQTALHNGTTTIPITQSMNGQTLLAHGEFDGTVAEETLTLSWVDYRPTITISESQNYVTITAPNANIIQYRLGSSGEYTNYTAPVYIASDTTIYVTATRTVSNINYTSEKSQAVTHELMPPTNLTISCTSNKVTISATNATTLEYNLDGGSNYTTYTEPFAITETVTVYAKATNSDGSITASQVVTYVDYRPTITISESQNYVTITAPNANIIQYRLGSSGEYANYTAPVYIASDTTIYVTATRTVSGVDYTSTASQAVTHELIPPTNLTISCSNNTVTISATNATTLEYNTDGSSTYTTYTEPFAITETVTVYAKATNSDGSITASQECEYSSGPDVPFAEDLLFYAPLTEGDLTDHISGVSPIQDANTTITWDSSKQMYLLNSKPNRSGYYVSPLRYVGVNDINVHNSPVTLFAQVICSKNGNNYCAMVIVPDWKTTGGKGKSHYYMGEIRFGGKDTSLRKYCGVWNGSGNAKFYKDGSLTSSASWGVSTKWTGQTGVAVCMANDTNEYEIYVKDVRIYGRALSDAEIAQL